MIGTRCLRPLVVWLVVMAAETIHGALRSVLLAPIVGDFRARQIAVFTGSVIVVLIVAAFIRWLGLVSVGSMVAVGLVWVVLTLGFELFLGRVVLRDSWERVLADFDLRRGGLLPIGLVVLALSPLLAAGLRGSRPPPRRPSPPAGPRRA